MRVLTFFITIIYLTETVRANDFESVASYFNSKRKTPQEIFKLVSQSSVDRKFVTTELKSISELPQVSVKEKVFLFSADGKVHRLESLNRSNNEYLLDGALFKDRPSGLLKDRISAIQNSNGKHVENVFRFFIPEAQGSAIAVGAVVAALGTMLGMTIYKDYKRHQPEGLCENLKLHFGGTVERMNEGFKDRYIPRLEEAAKSRVNVEVQNAIYRFNTFNDECGDIKESETSDHSQHCLELGQIYKCSEVEMNTFLKVFGETRALASKEGKSTARWDAISGIEQLRSTVERYRQIVEKRGITEKSSTAPSGEATGTR